MPFICPLCQQVLHYAERIYRCEQNHCFDEAKAGYVNLLLAQHKRSREPGDSKAMLQSRQRFLNAKYYEPLADRISEWVKKLNPSSLIDMGCGEGYYLARILSDVENAPEVVGIDIAKPAVHMAARRKMGADLAVASAYQLPVADQSMDLALSVFSPVSPEEVSRVLKPGGYLLMVGPGPEHLQVLIAHIYDNPQPHEGNTVTEDVPGLQKITEDALSFELRVSGEHVFDLLTMTPYYWKCNQEQQKSFQHMDALQTPVDFYLRVYQRI